MTRSFSMATPFPNADSWTWQILPLGAECGPLVAYRKEAARHLF